ncbi:MAG: universal stress protein [Knoellia sp.]
MNINEAPRSVVVGYDSSHDGDAAFDWALGEAGRRDLPVSLLVARGVRSASVPGLGAAVPWPEGLTGEIVEEARRYAADRASGVRVTVETSLGSPAAVLVEASARAEIIVVGRHEHTAAGEAFWGSTPTQVIAHAACPVVVVDRPFSGAHTAPIVVGVDGSEEGQAALEFAFRRAADLGAPIVGVHSWWIDVPGNLTLDWLTDEMREELEAAAAGALAEALAPWGEKFPDVRVSTVLRQLSPVGAILGEADDAQLIVVGSRGHGGFVGLVLGSVSQGLLHRRERRCPLVVLHGAKDHA